MPDTCTKDIYPPLPMGRKNGRMGSDSRTAMEKVFPQVRLSSECVLDKKEVFGREAPLYLEIGFGSGSFLLDNAVNSPESDFIGIEIFRPGIAKLMKRLISSEYPEEIAVTNIKVYDHDARSVLVNNISRNSLYGVYILFPDPWPKTRHNKRRLITPELTRMLYSLLKPGGHTVVATDHREYALWIERAFDTAGFTADISNVSGTFDTKYALKAFNRKNRVRLFRFIKH